MVNLKTESASVRPSTIDHSRVHSEKIESLRLNSFGLLRSLTIQMKCRISAGLVLIALLVPEMAHKFAKNRQGKTKVTFKVLS